MVVVSPMISGGSFKSFKGRTKFITGSNEYSHVEYTLDFVPTDIFLNCSGTSEFFTLCWSSIYGNINQVVYTNTSGKVSGGGYNLITIANTKFTTKHFDLKSSLRGNYAEMLIFGR